MVLLSASTRRARSRLANAARFGEDVESARTTYDVGHAIDVVQAIRGSTTPEQLERLHNAVDATAGGDRS